MRRGTTGSPRAFAARLPLRAPARLPGDRKFRRPYVSWLVTLPSASTFLAVATGAAFSEARSAARACPASRCPKSGRAVSYTHLRAHETSAHL
eukprot:8237181-Alexandrium_andersonii.AAC.1